MSNTWACFCVSATLWHPWTPPAAPLPPPEGNSYSLAITGKMMCALKCALPAWLPLREPFGAKWGGGGGALTGAKGRERNEGWWESDVRARRWIMALITWERFDQISSIVPCKWVSREERCGDCNMREAAQMASHFSDLLLVKGRGGRGCN